MRYVDPFHARISAFNKRKAAGLNRSLMAPSKANASDAPNNFTFTFRADADPEAIEKARAKMVHFGASPDAVDNFSHDYEKVTA